MRDEKMGGKCPKFRPHRGMVGRGWRWGRRLPRVQGGEKETSLFGDADE